MPIKFYSKLWFQVLECHLVTDPDTREFRGFAFVTVETTEDADRCIKYLNCSVLEGRLITMEKVLLPSMDFEEKYVGGGGLFTYRFLSEVFSSEKCSLMSFASRSGMCSSIEFTI